MYIYMVYNVHEADDGPSSLLFEMFKRLQYCQFVGGLPSLIYLFIF